MNKEKALQDVGYEPEHAKEVEEVEEDKKKGKKDFIEISKIIDDENKIIVEQVYDEKSGNRFCVYNHKNEKIEYTTSYMYNDVEYAPIIAEEIEKKAVLLPSSAEEYTNNDTLDKEILTFAKKWLDAPDEIMKFGLWNTKVSYVYENFHTLNYLRYQGDTGTGKTRGLDVWGHLHYKPIFADGNTTPAPLFRIIDKWRGTLVMDEADLRQSDESDQIIKILNSGFERGKFIMRCDQNDASKISFFEPFCPKILATRRSFKDKATESRCITYVTSVTNNKDIPLNLNKDFKETALNLRNKLLMWRFKNYFEIDQTKQFDFGDVEPRVKQIVGSYISLFSTDTKQMEEFKKYIQDYQKELIEERQTSFDGAIVEAIHNLLTKGKLEIDNKDIIEQGEFTGRDGKIMKPQAIANILKSLGLKKDKGRLVDGKTKRPIIIDENINKILKRYGFENYNITTITTPMETSKVVIKKGLDEFDNLRGSRKGCNTCNSCNNNKEENLIVDELKSTQKVAKKASEEKI